MLAFFVQSIKDLKETLLSQRWKCVSVLAAILNLERPERRWITLPGLTQKKTLFASVLMHIMFCHNNSVVNSAVLCRPVLLAFLLGDTSRSLFATSAKHWQKSNTRNIWKLACSFSTEEFGSSGACVNICTCRSCTLTWVNSMRAHLNYL